MRLPVPPPSAFSRPRRPRAATGGHALPASRRRQP